MVVKTQAAEKLPDAEVFNLPEGGQYVVLRRNQATEEIEDGTVYTADEVSFRYKGDPLTAKTANTEQWWQYGASYDPNAHAPTTDERLAAVEDAVLAMLMGGLM